MYACVCVCASPSRGRNEELRREISSDLLMALHGFIFYVDYVRSGDFVVRGKEMMMVMMMISDRPVGEGLRMG